MGKATAVILAAGKGTRMRSARPKVLHEVCGITLLECVIEAVQNAEIPQIIVVVGDKKEEVKDSLKGVSVKIVEQREQLGTAHAVLSASHLLSGITDVVMVLNGDAPLVKTQTLKRLIAAHREADADLTLLTAFLDRPEGYGRILRYVSQNTGTAHADDYFIVLGNNGHRAGQKADQVCIKGHQVPDPG